MDDPTEEDYSNYLERILAKFKQDPKFKLRQEFGEMLKRHIATFSPEELKRYNELKELLNPNNNG